MATRSDGAERGTITSTSPLKVKTNGSVTDMPAVKLQGLSWTPAVGLAVAVVFFADNGQPLILGPWG